MRVLIIGGTRFVGRHLAQEAIDRGHELVLFNRGLTNPGLFPQVRHIYGDRRTNGLRAVAGEDFDAVFDTCAYHPADVMATQVLAGNIAHYTLVSTVSVYRQPLVALAGENAPVWTMNKPVPRTFATPEEYGALKALSEAAAAALYEDRLLVGRPGLIVGPHDYSDRLMSWLRRLHQRAEVLAGAPAQPLQLIDVRDLARWFFDLAERGIRGTFNAVGPESPLTFKNLFEACSVNDLHARIVWAGETFLRRHGVELPLCVPTAEQAFFQLSNARARSLGLAFRKLEHTISDILDSDWEQLIETPGTTVMSSARENDLIAAYNRNDAS